MWLFSIQPNPNSNPTQAARDLVDVKRLTWRSEEKLCLHLKESKQTAYIYNTVYNLLRFTCSQSLSQIFQDMWLVAFENCSHISWCLYEHFEWHINSYTTTHFFLQTKEDHALKILKAKNTLLGRKVFFWQSLTKPLWGFFWYSSFANCLLDSVYCFRHRKKCI